MRPIDADALITELNGIRYPGAPYVDAGIRIAVGKVCDAPTIEERKTGEWTPVKMRPMDSEEREYWEDQFGEELEDEDAVMFDCPMPEDGQEILVSYRKWISMDKCEIDGGCYGLEGNGDWEDVIAWMPQPEPYREEGTE